ncbi:hypothetical protein Pst134EA_000110 [Puccinia striiformis f. sp. tritici]|uniref:hypothetical protein n=1 Tax=Puccinia striiformis f. sp. tritici TaxID=168172 RepID=UPI002008E846|nr:hypothetical protein Pst134EA_000110 [Puccinia striiformis f. sp. tritici]KAH9473032.1 hypothetical protein Pst134EA_000110 [Puccinia striiformis f. sp. tritici]
MMFFFPFFCEQHPAMKRAIERLSKVTEDEGKEIVNELLILSNSNSKFIELVLQHHGLLERFGDAVITNPARWDPEDPNRLLLHRRVDPKDIQHGCTVGCSANMCKGRHLLSFFFSFECNSHHESFTSLTAAELIAYLDRTKEVKSFDRIAYVGDGDNDYCPISRVLKSGDVALVRSRRELARRIEAESANGNTLSCRVVLWEGAWEVEQIVLNTLLKAP